jgi:hypothetical protein
MTTSTDITQATKITLLKHLASGKSPDVVAAIVGLKRDEVVDIASHHGYPHKEKLAWAADVLEKDQEDEAAQLPTRAPERPESARIAGPGPQPPEPLTRPDEIRVLLNTAKGHESKRIQNAANKVIDDLDKLRTLIREDQDKHAARRKAEAEKAAARAEVDRLEAQLAEAKAKLRGGKPTPKTPAEPKPARVQGSLDYPCGNDGCDKAYDTPQGRSLHERMKCEHRAEAVAS